jgi:hypothetical protein
MVHTSGGAIELGPGQPVDARAMVLRESRERFELRRDLDRFDFDDHHASELGPVSTNGLADRLEAANDSPVQRLLTSRDAR